MYFELHIKGIHFLLVEYSLMMELDLSCPCVCRLQLKLCLQQQELNVKTPWAGNCSRSVSLHNLGSQMPIKGARMWLCSVAKCKLLIFYAIIYDGRHSKHINDRLRCAQDNGATCLKLQNRFLFWRPQTLSDVHVCARTHTHRLLSFPSYPRLKCKQRGSVTELICPLLIHAVWTGARALFLCPRYLSPARSMPVLSPCPGHDQRQLCDTERGIQETENIKPAPRSNSQKEKR